MRSQIVISSLRYGGRRYLPYVFTEHGAVMAANVLKSPTAVRMSVFVVRAFVRMRAVLSGQEGLATKLADLEKNLLSRLDKDGKRLDAHEAAIVDVLQRLMELLEPPPLPAPAPPKPPIGFHVKL